MASLFNQRRPRWLKRWERRYLVSLRRKVVMAAGWANRLTLEAQGQSVREELLRAAVFNHIRIPRSLRNSVRSFTPSPEL
jgi:hypothetical protein